MRGPEGPTFWVVTTPKISSTFADVIFSATVREMVLQGRGGLRADEVEGVFTSKVEAMALAARLLHEVQPEDEPTDSGHRDPEETGEPCPVCGPDPSPADQGAHAAALEEGFPPECVR